MSDMIWEWHGAYVEDVSQAELAAAIKTTMEELSGGLIRAVNTIETGRYEFSRAAQLLLFMSVSPQVHEWTAFWGAEPRFCSRVFQHQKLSGIQFHGMVRRPGGTDPGKNNSWEWKIWQSGELMAWFISNPKIHFHLWHHALTEVVVPYLQQRVGGRDGHCARDREVQAFIQQHLHEFKPLLADIEPYALAGISQEELHAWLGMDTRRALELLPNILRLPFAGPEFYEIDLATCMDLQNGLIQPPQDLRYLYPEAPDRTRRDEEWVQKVMEFTPILFDLGGRDHTETIYIACAELFFYT